MKPAYAKRMAFYYLKKFKLDKWKFEWAKGTNVFGECDWENKKIRLSLPLTEANKAEEVKDTILHEIAHALCPNSHDHNNKWKIICHKIGAKPEAKYTDKEVKRVKNKS